MTTTTTTTTLAINMTTPKTEITTTTTAETSHQGNDASFARKKVAGPPDTQRRNAGDPEHNSNQRSTNTSTHTYKTLKVQNNQKMSRAQVRTPMRMTSRHYSST